MSASAISHSKLRLYSSKLFPRIEEHHAGEEPRVHTVKLVTSVFNKQAEGPAFLCINLCESLRNFKYTRHYISVLIRHSPSQHSYLQKCSLHMLSSSILTS